MKQILFAAIIILAACNSNEEGTPQSQDSSAARVDTLGDTRGMKGSGVDNNGGTPGPGTITDTLNGQVDTADHTSKRNADTTKNK